MTWTMLTTSWKFVFGKRLVEPVGDKYFHLLVSCFICHLTFSNELETPTAAKKSSGFPKLTTRLIPPCERRETTAGTFAAGHTVLFRLSSFHDSL